jgi:four helix bundle protein
MASFSRFEDIQAWQKARKVTKRIYQITRNENFSKDYSLRDQIRRSSVSIMANIAEGQGRHSSREFANFLNIAHGSIAETQSHLYIAFDLSYLERKDFDEVYGQLDEIARMTMALSQYLRSQTFSTRNS